MAHFAKLDKENTVIDILKVDNDLIKDSNGVEQESIGIQKLQEGNPNYDFVQTSYNTEANEHRNGGTPFRKNYAMMGGTYDADKDAFIDVKPPFASWQLNEETCVWEAPVPMPDDHETNPVVWDEANQEWVEFNPIGDEPDLGEKP